MNIPFSNREKLKIKLHISGQAANSLNNQSNNNSSTSYKRKGLKVNQEPLEVDDDLENDIPDLLFSLTSPTYGTGQQPAAVDVTPNASSRTTHFDFEGNETLMNKKKKRVRKNKSQDEVGFSQEKMKQVRKRRSRALSPDAPNQIKPEKSNELDKIIDLSVGVDNLIRNKKRARKPLDRSKQITPGIEGESQPIVDDGTDSYHYYGKIE